MTMVAIRGVSWGKGGGPFWAEHGRGVPLHRQRMTRGKGRGCLQTMHPNR